MLDVHLPDLTFPNLTYGRHETPWDLRRFIYKGGARAAVKTVAANIEAGTLGRPLVERIELVRQIHEVLENYSDRGGRRKTVATRIQRLGLFFRWADEADDDGNELRSYP